MIGWLNNTFGITNEVSVPTLISVIVFVVGGLVKFLFQQFNALYNRIQNRKTFFLLLELVIKDLKIKITNVQDLRNQVNIANAKGYSYSQKSIIHLHTIFEYGFKEIFYSFRRKFFWNPCTRNIKNKAFHKIWDALKELEYFEPKIYEHLEKFDAEIRERIDNYNVAVGNVKEFRTGHGTYFENQLKHPVLNKFFEEEKKIWTRLFELDYSTSDHFHSYNNLIAPLLNLSVQFYSFKETSEFYVLLRKCKHEYEEIEIAIVTYNRFVSIYLQFYRNKSRLVKKCLSIIMA